MAGLLDLPASAQDEIRRALGLSELHDHAGITGMAYLRRVDEKRYFDYFRLPEDIDWPMIKSVSVAGLAYFRQPTQAELEAGFLYCYDRNSSHGYAASQIKAGIGQPKAYRNVTFDHLVPGFWAASIEGEKDLWSGLALLPTHRDWLPTPLLKMAEKQGCTIKVEEAYIWPEKAGRAPVFTRWANNLWGFRQQHAAGTPERQAFKDMLNKSIGLLRRQNGQGHRDYRPDWYSLILAEERAVVWYKALQVYKATGLWPVGAYHDALYYLTDSPIYALEWTPQGKPAKDALGGYKVEWRLALEQGVKKILLQPKVGAADRIHLLKEWGATHGFA